MITQREIWARTHALGKQTNCEKREVGCIIYDSRTKRVVAEGHNRHPNGICDCFNKDKADRTAIHAEDMAVKYIPDYCEKEDLIAFVTRKPCVNCQGLLVDRVGEVRYRNY